MNLKSIITLSLVIIIQGCAVKLPPKSPVPDNAKIGIMVLINDKPKHVHVGTTMFNNFENESVSEWNIISSVYKTIKKELNGYHVIKIKPSQNLINSRLNFISAGWDSFHFNEELAAELNLVTKHESIDFLVTVEPFSSSVETNSAVNTSGYGLLTRCSFGMCRAEALNHVISRVYAMNPPRLVSWGIASKYKLPVELSKSSFDDLKNIPATEIDKAKVPFITYLNERIKSALERAGLTSRSSKTEKPHTSP